MNPEPRLPLSADPDKQAEILEVIAQGATPRTAAAAAGIHVETLQRFLDNDPSFRQRFHQAQAALESEMVARIREAAKTNPRAAAWLRDHPHPAPKT